MKINQIKAGALLSYLQMMLQIIIGLLYTPIMIKLLGQSDYGLYNTVASMISTLGILNLGFSGSYIRYFSKYKRENNEHGMKKLNGTFIILFTVIGIIAGICGGYLTLHLDVIFAHGLTLGELEKARILMLLLTFNLAMSFPMSVFGMILSAYERFVFQKGVGAIQTVLTPCLTLPLLLLGYGSIGLVLISVILTIVTWIINIWYCLFKLKVSFKFRGLDFKLFKSMFVYSFFIALNLIVDQINWNIDKILLGRFKGTSSVAVYSVGFSLYTYYQNFSTSISNVFTPRIHAIINSTEKDSKHQKEHLTDLFTKVGRIQFLVLALIATGVIFFGRDFIIYIWAGKGYQDAYPVALLLILPATIALIQNLGIEIQRAENRHQFRSIVYTGMAIVNLVLSIILCQRFGAIGSALGTTFSLILANGFIMNFYYHLKCNIDIVYFWKQILYLSRGLILPCMLGIMFQKIEYSNIIQFGCLILIYMMTYVASMWFFGMNKYEKELLKISKSN